MTSFRSRLEAEKRASTSQLLFKCARIVNEYAIATLPERPGPRPRPAHMALFPHVSLQDGTRLSDLATRLGISKQAVTQLVDDLETMGVLARVPDPDDGRAKRVIFTKVGRESIMEGLAHLKDVERKLARAIGKDAMAALHAALTSLHDHLEEDPEGGPPRIVGRR